MIPNHAFTVIGVPSPYLWGAELRSTATESWEMGGAGISDPSGGLTFQLWYGRLELDTGTVLLSAPNTPEFVLYSEAGITQMDFSFDQNMKPCLAFTQNGVAKFWWYNTVNLQYETIILPALSTTPLTLLDDKRVGLLGSSDIILFYLREGRLYYREQRDRFTVEYDSGIAGVRKLLRVGFTEGLRVQLMVLM